MNELKFNSQVCTTKIQSQRLLDLGLKPETADMYHTTFYRDNVGHEIIQVRNEKLPLLSQELPAWSLHRLMEIYSMSYDDDCYVVLINEAFNDLIEDIEWRINKGYLNKEYLKQ